MGDIVELWDDVVVPPVPELREVTVDAATGALLMLDFQTNNCNAERRPRCVASLPVVAELLARARAAGVTVVYSLTSSAESADIRTEVAPLPHEPIVKAGAGRSREAELAAILEERGVRTVVVTGTSAHGAVLHTATGAAQRGFSVIVPVDGMSATDTYAEQYTAWHLLNVPGRRRVTTLTRCKSIRFA